MKLGRILYKEFNYGCRAIRLRMMKKKHDAVKPSAHRSFRVSQRQPFIGNLQIR